MRTLDHSKFAVAAQNCGSNGKGAYTGEVAPDMLVDSEIPWVILGHSERRLVIGSETNEEVAGKAALALKAGLKVRIL